MGAGPQGEAPEGQVGVGAPGAQAPGVGWVAGAAGAVAMVAAEARTALEGAQAPLSDDLLQRRAKARALSSDPDISLIVTAALLRTGYPSARGSLSS